MNRTSLSSPGGLGGWDDARKCLADIFFAIFTSMQMGVTRLQHNAVTVAGYDYLGMSQVVGVHHPEPGVFRRHDSGTMGVYPDLDRFGRLTASRWTRDLTTDIDFVANTLSYDRNSSITWSEDGVHFGRDVKYTMDGLNRLVDAEEGTRAGGSITSRTRREEWSLQQVGNWDLFKLDLNGDGDQGDAGELADKGTFKTSGGTGFNELRYRDTNNDASNDVTRVYDKNGNLTDDGVAYAFEYDAFNRLRTIRNRSNSALVEEYTYNGLGHRIGWHYDVDADGTVESNADDPWYFFAYDEAWRMVATFRDDDAEPKEFFINHQAGLGGMSLSLGLDATILRDRDTKGEWWEEADIRNERVYHCQDLRNGRADVLCLVRDDGTRVESVRYSPYGVPFGIPGPDANGDGLVNSADLSVVLSSQGKSVGDPGYTVLADINLDGTVNSADITLLTGYAGGAMGRGVLSNSVTRNRKGYAGYEHDGVIHVLAHVRHRVYEIERGRWMQRDPLGFVDGGNVYGYGQQSPIHMADSTGLCTSASVGCKNATSEPKAHMPIFDPIPPIQPMCTLERMTPERCEVDYVEPGHGCDEDIVFTTELQQAIAEVNSWCAIPLAVHTCGIGGRCIHLQFVDRIHRVDRISLTVESHARPGCFIHISMLITRRVDIFRGVCEHRSQPAPGDDLPFVLVAEER